MRKVAIIGAGLTKISRHWDKSLQQLFAEALDKALASTKISKADAIFVGNMCAQDLSRQNNLGALVADYSGHLPATSIRIEAACASAGAAILTGYMAVASGLYDIVVAGGVEKLSEMNTKYVTEALGKASNVEYELFYGASFVSLNALMMKLYMETYGVDRTPFAEFAVLMHKNASVNPYAQLPFEITLDKALSSEYIAEPISLYDCAPIGDGAAVLIMCPLEEARKYADSFVEVAGIASATDTVDLASRDDILLLSSTKIAAEKAYKMAKIAPRDVDVVEIHDTFTIMGFVSLESLGVVERGKTPKYVKEGVFEKDEDLPVNPSGGLKASGHPVGATGAYQVAYLTLQLLDAAGKMQVPSPEYGLAQNLAGTASGSYITILKRAR